jgi:redox-sensitive bicupin YhaK (pirin superfamily)
LEPGRKTWVQVVRGAIEVNGKAAAAGDGVAVEGENKLSITARADGSAILVFDLP